jgi:Ca2+-binding RTX toxin-like protein
MPGFANRVMPHAVPPHVTPSVQTSPPLTNPRPGRGRRGGAGAAAAASLVLAALALAPPAEARTTAQFASDRGILTVTGDLRGNAIVVSRTRNGVIEVNGGTVDIGGRRATIANVTRIVVRGGSGNDRLALDDGHGPLPSARLFGDGGRDELFGGSERDRLVGGSGSDSLLAGGGNDVLSGGAGDDQLVWNPGDGSDLDEGGDGSDTVLVNGGDFGESFVAAAEGARVRFERVSPTPFSLDIGTSERLVVNAGGGDDSFVASGDLAPVIAISVDGGAGNDRIRGGNGNDRLSGGAGDDDVDGNQGADSAFLGDGSDTFVWDAGDGSDVVDGESGADRLVFNGAEGAENLNLSANGSRVRLVRDVGQVTMDLHGIEQVDVNPLAGADTVTVADLSGTDVTGVGLSLAGSLNPKAGDGADDHVVVNGTEGADRVKLTGTQADGLTVEGLQAVVRVFGPDGPSDAFALKALGGNDTVDATGVAAGVVSLTLDGGAGADVLSGGPGTVVIP